MATKRQDAAPKKGDAFLAAYRECGSVSYAARAEKINRCTHYRWLQQYPEYTEAFAEAREEAADVLEQEARRRAVEGVEAPVFYKGEVCGTVKRYSDVLLIFLLKGARPDKYRERYEVTEDQDRSLVPDPGRDVLPDHVLDKLIALEEAIGGKDEPTEEWVTRATKMLADGKGKK